MAERFDSNSSRYYLLMGVFASLTLTEMSKFYNQTLLTMMNAID